MMDEGCRYDVESRTTNVRPCGAPTVDGVYCETHAQWMRDLASPEFVAWWQAEARKAENIQKGDAPPYKA